MIDLSVPPALAGERIDRVVSLLTGASRADASSLVAAGSVRVNGAVVTARAHRVSEDDRVEVDWDGPAPDVLPGPEPEVAVRVVHEDADLLVVDKDPGVVVHPGAGHATGTLVSGLLARYPELAEVGDPARPGIVHRLDRDTSGLLLVARSPEAYETLVAEMAAHVVDRRYRALVWGVPEHPSGSVDAPIGRSRRDPTRMAVSEEGRPAVTHYEVQATWERPAVAWVRCRLETGRTHQIRVHLGAIGHAVVGDPRYRGVRQGIDAPRVVLHASRLGLSHPVTGEPLVFTSPLPDDLRGVLDGLGAPASGTLDDAWP